MPGSAGVSPARTGGRPARAPRTLVEAPAADALVNPKSEILNPKSLIVLAVLALLLSELPLALSWCCGPRDLTGVGTFWFINDFAQYEAAMDQGARGSGWLIYDRLTPETHQPALMFPLYVGLGKLAAATGLPTEAVYRATEVLARGALLWSLAAFALWLFGSGRTASLTFGLSIFGMGLGLPVAIVGSLLGLTGLYTGNGSYETNTFGLLFSAPHAALAMALTLSLPMAYQRFLAEPSRRPLLGLALTALGLALLHPFNLPILLLALAIDGWLRWRGGASLTRLTLAVGVPSLLTAPLLAYTALTFNVDPFWGATYGAQNLLPSPRPWELPVDFGVVLLLAIPGALALARQPSSRTRWLLLWAGVMLLSMYLPVPYQRRLSFGLQPTLAALAALGLLATEMWLREMEKARLSRWLQPVALALALMTTATAGFGILASAVRDEPMHPYRATTTEAEAAAWLANTVRPDQVVLAEWDTSNYLGGRMPGRVLGGHPVATLHPAQRRHELAAFFQAGESERKAFVQAYGVNYIFFGHREQALGTLAGAPWLQAVYERPGVVVFAVDGTR